MRDLREYAPEMPLRTERVTVILMKGDEPPLFATSVTHKQGLVQKWRQDGGRFVAVWTGQFRSDAFDLPANVMETEFG